jgi:DNA polymerase-4
MPPGDFEESILHVDMDAFFVEVERLRDRRLQGRPVVVGGGGNRGVVASASYEARRYGIQSAMPMARARRACPLLVIVPPDHDEYARVSHLVFEIFATFTPLVEGLSLDEAFLDVAGLRRRYRHPLEIAQAIRADIRTEVGLPASVGVAATKFVAKLASEAAKPDGVRHVPRHETLHFLHALPVGSLWGVGQATHALLEEMGIETVGDLAQVDQGVLERRLGMSASHHLSSLARGVDPRTVISDVAVKSLSVSETYDRDLTTDDEIAFELRRLCERLGQRLRRAGVRGRSVSIRVRFADFRTQTRSLTLPDPTNSTLVIRQSTRSLLDRVDLSHPIRLLGVELAGLVSADEPLQLDTDGDDKRHHLEVTVDEIRTRYGSNAIGSASSSRRLIRPPTGSD